MSAPEMRAPMMAQAVRAATEHVARGGLPFVGVVVNAAGEPISGFGVNRVRETGDPTAHAEVVAMRDAMARGGRDTLSDCALLATGEPCGLCYRYAIDRGIDTIHVAIDRDQVAALGFDYRASYPAFGITDGQRTQLFRPLTVAYARAPFTHYLDLQHPGRATARPDNTSKGFSS